MPRPKGSRNRPKMDALEEMPVNAENFIKLQSIRAGYQTKIDDLKAEITRVDKVLVKFADWMETEARRIRQQAK